MKKFLGIALIALGVLGLVLPIFPGWLIIFAGLALLRGQRKSLHCRL